MRRSLALAAALVAVAVAGCGGDDDPQAGPEPDPVSPTTPGGGPPRQSIPSKPARPQDVEVIRRWVDALRAGRVKEASRWFALPATVENGSPVLELPTREAVQLFNRSLPCGARVVEVRRYGRFTVATFVLTERPGVGRCGSGTGEKAATAFLFRGGKISEWRRIAVPPPAEPEPKPERPVPQV